MLIIVLNLVNELGSDISTAQLTALMSEPSV